MGKAFSKNGNKFSRSRQATVALGTDQNRWCTPVQARPQLAVPRITVSPPRNPTQANSKQVLQHPPWEKDKPFLHEFPTHFIGHNAPEISTGVRECRNGAMTAGQKRTDLPVTDTPLAGLRGLDNLGNTCYFNSAIQCLAATSPFRDTVLSEEWREKSKAHKRPKTLHELFDLISQIWTPLPSLETTSSYLNAEGIVPTGFKRSLDADLTQFRGYDQHDAQEFLSAIIDMIHEEYKDSTSGEKPQEEPDITTRTLKITPEKELANDAWKRYKELYKYKLMDTFHGLQVSRITCLTCSEISIKFEPFASMSLPVVDIQQNRQLVKLTDCITSYMSPEILQGSEKWMCPKCKELRSAEKTVYVHRYPKVLICHLKRFMYCKGQFEKLNGLIDLNWRRNPTSNSLEIIESFPYKKSVKEFRLFAIINHSGRFHAGHYSAACWHKGLGRWIAFDDNIVCPITDISRDLISASNYVLFFEQLSKSRDSNPLPTTNQTYGIDTGRMMHTLQTSSHHDRQLSAPVNYISSPLARTDR